MRLRSVDRYTARFCPMQKNVGSELNLVGRRANRIPAADINNRNDYSNKTQARSLISSKGFELIK